MKLRPHEDAYGRMIYDHLRGQPVTEVVERDDGWIGVSREAERYFAPYRDWPSQQRDLVDRARGRVLDVGCGAGRCCLHLQERAVRVVGIDLSPLAVRTCRRRGVRDARVLSITEISKRLGRFDCILMVGNNLGLLGGERRGRWLLRRFHAVTGPGASVVAETTDPYATTRLEHRSYHRLNRRRGRLGGQLRIRVRYQTYRTPWFDYLLASKRELRSLVRDTGWHVGDFVDGEEGRYGVVLDKD